MRLKRYSVSCQKKKWIKTHKEIIHKIEGGIDDSRCKVKEIGASELALGFHCCWEHFVDFGELSKIL